MTLDTTVVTGDKDRQKPLDKQRIGVMDSFTAIIISPNGAWLIGIGGRKIYIWRTALLSSGFTTFGSPENLTCIAFHPSSEYFATGDETARRFPLPKFQMHVSIIFFATISSVNSYHPFARIRYGRSLHTGRFNRLLVASRHTIRRQHFYL